MFEASAPFALFDYHRVPYAVTALQSAAPEAWGTLTWRGTGAARTVKWPRLDSGVLRPSAAVDGAFRIGDVPIRGHVVPTPPHAGEVVLDVTDSAGRVVSAIRRDAAGGLVLPFDPGEVTLTLLSERYQRIGRSATRTALTRAAKSAYYRLRPALPRSLQLALRRRFSTVQARAQFPRWPTEPALQDLHDGLLALLAEVAGEALPRIAAWPGGSEWALVLTHDVETDIGLDHLHLMRDTEVRHGVRSSWNLVARRYEVEDRLVEELLREGFEVGVHGLYHDGRDIAPSELPERLPEMRRLAARWGAAGFRSPATNRDWHVMRRLGFDYDSSYPDADPYEPDSGGCCSWLPFFNGDLVELPITLPQDHTLFEILERPLALEWFEKTELLAQRGAMALLITHPDYMLAPDRLATYERFLERFAHDPTAWRALPRDVSGWWRRRASSRIVGVAGKWRIEGPASEEGRIELLHPSATAAWTIGQGAFPPPDEAPLTVAK